MFKRKKSLLNKTGMLARIYENSKLVKKVRRRRRVWNILKFLSYIIIAFLFICIFFFSYAFYSAKTIIASINSSSNDLEQSFLSFREGEYQSSQILAKTSEERFAHNNNEIEDLQQNYFLLRAGFLGNETNRLKKYNSLLQLIASSLSSATEYAQEFDKWSRESAISFSTNSESKAIWRRIYESSPNMDDILKNFSEIQTDLGGFQPGILAGTDKQLANLNFYLSEINSTLKNISPLADVIPLAAGYPEQKNYLLVFSNEKVRRPHGGKIEYLAMISIKDGFITRMDMDAASHIDVQSEGRYYYSLPEQLVAEYSDSNWDMGMANWSPHWPIAATQILNLYLNKLSSRAYFPASESTRIFDKDLVDGVINIPYEVLGSVLSAIGPINIDGKDYGHDEFLFLMQNEDDSQNSADNKAELLSRVIYRIQNRLLNPKFKDWAGLASVFDNANRQSLISAYFKDPATQNIVIKSGYGGGLKETGGDYLCVIDFDLSADTKTKIKRNISYSLIESPDGLYADLNIDYLNLDKKDETDKDFKNYLRVYVPIDSELIDDLGLDKEVLVQNELGKTSFGAVVSVPSGESKSIKFRFKLSPTLEKDINQGHYAVYFQKHEPSQEDQLSVDLSFMDGIRLYSPNGLNIDKNNKKMSWSSGFSQDMSFELYLQ